MKNLFAIFIFLFPALVSAKTEWGFYPLNLQARFERAEDQSLKPVSVMNGGLEARQGSWSLMAEISRFEIRTGNSYAGADRVHEESLLWIRRHVDSIWSTEILLGAGLGIFRETVTTKLEGWKSSDQSGNEFLTGIVLGGARTFAERIRVSVEGRLLYSSGLEPKLQPDLVFRTGITF